MATRPDISPDARVDFDHHSDEYNLHELAINAGLRRKCPVAWNDNYGGFWFLSSYDAVSQAARDGDTFAHKYEPNAADGVDYQGEMGVLISSLVASLDDGLTCAILGVPAVDLVNLVGRHARLSGHTALRHTMNAAKPLGRMISPLALTPRVPKDGRFIYAGIADRLVHPREQVTRLWEHWGKPEIQWYPGGHTGFFRSRPVQRFIDGALVQSGLTDRR